MGDKYDAKARELAALFTADPYTLSGVTAIASALRSAAAEEREECAKIVRGLASQYADCHPDSNDHGIACGLAEAVSAIRSRGIPND